MIPKLRHVIANDLSYDVFSLAVEEDRMAYRILVEASCPWGGFDISEKAQEVDINSLKTTECLGSEVATDLKDKYFVINKKKYVILVEAIVDKNDKRYKGSWIPGCHFACHFDGKKIQIHNIGSLTFFTLMNTISTIRQKGGFWGFDFWVRNPEAPMTELSRSITTTPKSIVITNVELGTVWDVEKVATGTTSAWLNLAYELTADKTIVKPDEWVTFTFKVLDGETKEVATDVSWHNYIVEPVDGYAPHRRMKVVNGVGTFRAQALGLMDGETMRMKVGRRFATGCAECTVNIQN